VILRQRLVARRERLHSISDSIDGKENVATLLESTSLAKNKGASVVDAKKRGMDAHSIQSMPRSLKQLDMNDRYNDPLADEFLDKVTLKSSAIKLDLNEDDQPSEESISTDQSQISFVQSVNGLDEEVVQIELIQCDCCKRSFAPKIYEKHFNSDGQPKCAMDKKRPVFNAAKVSLDVWLLLVSFKATSHATHLLLFVRLVLQTTLT
jgi:hypothetical protein